MADLATPQSDPDNLARLDEAAMLAVRTENRSKVMALQGAMLALPDEQKLDVDAMTRHHFGDRLYVREMVVPSGAAVVGMVHRSCHGFFLLEGVATVFTEHGKSRVAAPHFEISPRGTKRSFFAHTPLRMFTAHGAESTDVPTLERELASVDYSEVPECAIEEAV